MENLDQLKKPVNINPIISTQICLIYRIDF